MPYIKKEDRDFISNKYHDTKKPFDSLRRFTRNDSLFDKSAGMDAMEIEKEIVLQDEKYKNSPHSIRKARGLEFVLDHTKILCDPRDIFPAIHCIDRPLEKALIDSWHMEVMQGKMPEIRAERNHFHARGIATLHPDYNHSVPIWERLYALGFSGILEESRKAKAQLESQRTLQTEEIAFYESVEIVYTAILRFIGRLAECAENTKGCERMAESLKRLQAGAPETFYDALLFNYLYFIISEHIDSVQVRSIGHFDRLLYPYYKKDLESGISEDELKKQLAYFFFQFPSIGNYWGQPVYLGGSDENGNTYINPLSYVFLEVYDAMNLYNPKLQIKYSKSIPEDFALKALDMMRRGHNSIVFVSEEHIKKALRYNGVAEKDIVHADIKGCYEFLVQGGMDSEDYQINMLKPLEFALHGGKDGMTGEPTGLACASDFSSFEALMEEYKRQLGHLIERSIEIVNAFEGYMSYINPLPLLSATMPSCITRAKDANSDGGVTNNTYMCLGGIATVADSLTAIKKYVYDQKLLSLEELVSILDRNFEGYEDFRRMLSGDKDKYGNNVSLPDSIAREIVDFASDCIVGKPNAPVRGGWWSCSTHIARGVYHFGGHSMASANGRLSGEELSKNLSATMGSNYNGVTAGILSATKFDTMKIQLNPMVDAALSPSAVRGEDGLAAMLGLIHTYFDLGGATIQFNIVNAEDLKEAQKNPEKYQDLQIRISGWNVLFNNIDKKEQDGFIRQAEMAK